MCSQGGCVIDLEHLLTGKRNTNKVGRFGRARLLSFGSPTVALARPVAHSAFAKNPIDLQKKFALLPGLLPGMDMTATVIR
jgi:hypothetical protein